MSEPPTFVIELRAIADPLAKSQGSRFARCGEYRLRLALKCLLRGFGLRCVGARPGTAADAAGRCLLCGREPEGGEHGPVAPADGGERGPAGG